jgi:hypothetical protein
MTSLLNAAEEGNVDAVQELFNSSTHFDVNISNRVSSHFSRVFSYFPTIENKTR